MSGGFTPSVHLHSQSRGKLIWSERLQAFLPGAAAERSRSAGACRGVFALRGACRSDGAAAGAAAAREALDPARRGVDSGRRRRPRRCRSSPRCVQTPGLVGALPRDGTHARPRLRRLAERRHHQGPGAGAARGFPLHRARQALHHHRHGDRPGQDLQPERARHRRARAGQDPAAGRAHHLPHALHAGDLRQLRRGWRAGSCSIPMRRTPMYELGGRHRARCSRTSGCGSAPATSRARARTCTRRWRASAAPRAAAAASSMPRRSARSRSSARMRSPS